MKQPVAKPLGEEMEFFRQHNEILFKKLEKKMSDLESRVAQGSHTSTLSQIRT
jgi:hypothetical protein